MIHRTTKLLVSVILLVWIAGTYSTASGQAEETVDKWIRESILRISHKVKELSQEYDDPFFVPSVLIGPIVTSTPGRKEPYESQFDLLLRNSIYLKIAAGLTPINIKVVDADVLPWAIAWSGLGSMTRLNAVDIASLYARDEAMRKCVKRLLDVADMVVLGQTNLKDSTALTTFRILRKEGDRLYLDRTAIEFQALPDIPDLSVTIGEDNIRRMMEFALSTDRDVRRAVEKFVRQFADAWSRGDLDKIMSYYDGRATAVTMTVDENSIVDLTSVLDRNALQHFWATSMDRYREVNFDFSKPRVYDIKRNARNVVSFSVGFYADVSAPNGGKRRLPLLSLHVQLRRAGLEGWKIYFQRIKEVPKYRIQPLER